MHKLNLKSAFEKTLQEITQNSIEWLNFLIFCSNHYAETMIDLEQGLTNGTLVDMRIINKIGVDEFLQWCKIADNPSVATLLADFNLEKAEIKQILGNDSVFELMESTPKVLVD